MAESSGTTTLITNLIISDGSINFGPPARPPVPVVAEQRSNKPMSIRTADADLPSSLLMMLDSSPITNLPEFSVDDYRFWKFRIRMFLKATHWRMWEIIQYGSMSITNANNEGQIVQLDNYAMLVISSTVGKPYLPIIINCNTAKEMWDALAAIGEESDEIKHIELLLACQKLDNFVQLKNESILKMELRFTAIIVDIETRRKGRYTQGDINRKVLDALSDEWSLYQVLHQCRTDLNELPTGKLFSILKANEYKINRRKAVQSADEMSEEELQNV